MQAAFVLFRRSAEHKCGRMSNVKTVNADTCSRVGVQFQLLFYNVRPSPAQVAAARRAEERREGMIPSIKQA